MAQKLKIIPGEMKDIDPDAISCVFRGANGIKAVIAKADEQESTETITEEKAVNWIAKGLGALFKGNIEKADNQTKKTALFAERMSISDTMSNLYNYTDTYRAVLRDIVVDPNITDKQAAWVQATNEFAAYMNKKAESLGKTAISKSIEEFLEFKPIEKAGKAISTANMKNIEAAMAALQAMMDGMKQTEQTEIKKECDTLETKTLEAIAKSLETLGKRLDNLENPQPTPATVEKSAEEKQSEALQQILKSVENLGERVGKIEKARCDSRQLDGEQGAKPIQKSGANVWDGYQVG